MIPTLFGSVTISFAVIQFAPDGPVEMVISQLTGQSGDSSDQLSGDGSNVGGTPNLDPAGSDASSEYSGVQGLDPE